MISEIVLDGVASYKARTSLKTDKKVNIIYGLNGSGKSTFSNYLYNRAVGDLKYSKCSHAHSNDNILVYNQQFIKDNFYEVGNLKGIFSLSKENKDAKEKIEAATRDIEAIRKEKSKLIDLIKKEEVDIAEAKRIAINTTWKIKQDYTGGDRVLEFCLKRLMGSSAALYDHISSIALPVDKPTKTINQLKDEANAVDGSTAIKLPPLARVDLQELSLKHHAILDKVIIGSADSPVAGLISKLNNSDWISEGLKYLDLVDDNRCPFCQSHTLTVELVSEIKNYFDESYQKDIEFLKKVQAFHNEIVSKLPDLEDYTKSPYTKNHLTELTQAHTEIEKVALFNANSIAEKTNNPSQKIKLQEISKSISYFNTVVDSINKLISEHNNRIDNSDKEMERIKLEFWNTLRCEYDHAIYSFEQKYSSSKKIIDTNSFILDEKNKDEKNKEQEIIEHQRSTVNIKDAIDNINLGLADLGITDFYIEPYKDGLYQIIREGEDTDIFSSLSEGEKMIISFLYFRELFIGKQTAAEIIKKKIAVIDDPVSSLSHIFVYNIGQLLKSDFFNSENIEQVFVLTHSLYFFYELADASHSRRKENQNLFRFSKNATGTSIEKMKYEEIQNDYQSYWSVINDDKQPPALIANCMRNIVEYFFNFVQKEDLSNVMQKPELKDNRFQAFIRYINRESHSLGQNIFDFKEFNYDDFRMGLKLVFQETGYSEHYNKMSKIN